MNRLAIPLSILAVTTIAGCAMPVREANVIPPAPAIQTQSTLFQSGSGVVQSVMAAPGRMGAAAGASASAANDGRMNRLTIKMDGSGVVQYVDTDSSDFRSGMRVELSADGKIRPI